MNIMIIISEVFTCGCTGPSSLGSPLFCSFLTRRACFTYPDLLYICSFQENYKFNSNFHQRLPTRTVPTAMRRITTRDMSKLFSSSAVLGEQIVSTSALAKRWRGVSFNTCTHRSSCQESWLGTGGSALLHLSPPVWLSATGLLIEAPHLSWSGFGMDGNGYWPEWKCWSLMHCMIHSLLYL